MSFAREGKQMQSGQRYPENPSQHVCSPLIRSVWFREPVSQCVHACVFTLAGIKGTSVETFEFCMSGLRALRQEEYQGSARKLNRRLHFIFFYYKRVEKLFQIRCRFLPVKSIIG